MPSMTEDLPTAGSYAGPIRSAPSATQGLGLGAWREFRRDPLEFLCRVSNTHGDVVRWRVGPMPIYLLRHPDAVQRVLVDRNRNYDKQTRGYDALRLFLRDGLLTSEGSFWRRQRRIAQPAFHRGRIAAFGKTMVDLTQAMLPAWERHADRGETVDVAEEMTSLTLRIVAKTLMSTDVNDRDNEVGRAVELLNAFARDLMTNPFTLPLSLPTPRNRRFRRAADVLERTLRTIIAQRRRTGEDAEDLLSMLMAARDEDTGESMSDEQLRDEAMTIFLAGHETTANALAWALYLLSTHPDVERRVRTELFDVLGDRAPTIDDLGKLVYLQQVVKETLRLYPPAWSIGRRAVEADVIDGYRIDAGSLVLLSPWVTHRHPAFWPNPEGFDPERFTPQVEQTRPRYAYFPFGGGPRLCIGNNFAMMEAQLVLATVLQRVSAALVPGHPVVPQPLITLRPAHGLRMSLHRAPSAVRSAS
jgi:cytochrome P450